MQGKRKVLLPALAMAVLLLPRVAHAQWDTGFNSGSAMGQLGQLTGQNVQGLHLSGAHPPMGGLNMGNAVGGMVAGMALNWLLSGNETAGPTQAEIEAENARQAALEQQRLEQERLARISNAAHLRADWDSRDVELSGMLDGVFNLPVPQSTPFFGIPGDPDPDAVAQALMDDSQDAVTNDASVVDLSDVQGQAVSGDLFQQGVVRAQQTPSYSSIQQPTLRLQPPSPQRDPFVNWGVQTEKQLLGKIAEGLTAEGKAEAMRQLEEYMIEHSPAYVFAKDVVTNIPGYSTAMQLRDSLKDLSEEYDQLHGLMEGQANRNLQLFQESATQTAAFLGSPAMNDAGLSDNIAAALDQRGSAMQQAYSKEAWNQAKQGYKQARAQDEEMVKASVGPENTNVVPVNGPSGHYMNLNRWLNQPNANFAQPGY